MKLDVQRFVNLSVWELRLSSNHLFDFAPPPPPPNGWVPLFGGAGGLVGLLRPLCVNPDPGPFDLFFPIWAPSPLGGGPGLYLWVPQIGPSGEDTAIFRPNTRVP